MVPILKCPKCSADIPLSDAFRKEIEAEMLTEERTRHAKELDEARTAAASAAAKKVEQDYASREITLRAEAKEERERNTRLLKQLEDLTGEMRALKRKDEERDLAYKQKLAEDEDRIRADTRKNVVEEFLLKDREKDKRLGDALRQVEELKAKMQQGSQQTQGEVLELELEELLRQEFKDDDITEVKKGQRGADVLQRVSDRRGRLCGTILWETKNAKWQETWLSKLRADQREAKAQIAVLVAVQPPPEVETFLEREGVWIVQRRYAKVLALVLRRSLIEIYAERANQAGKDEKMEVLYQYLTSVEFQHRIQAIVEGFSHLWKDVESEKRWFATKWARQEKEIRKIIDSTQGMYGDLQAVTGRSLTAIPALEGITDLHTNGSAEDFPEAFNSRRTALENR
jgi:hypothetical protein